MGGAAAVTVKFVLLVAVPPGVVTAMGPVVAAAGTAAVICVPPALTVYAGWLTPLNLTLVAPVRFVPLMVTLVPTGPDVGAKLVMVGAGAVSYTHLDVYKRQGCRRSHWAMR